MTKLVFLHGWGFDASLWHGVRAMLAPFDCVLADRGYFGGPARVRLDGAALAIGHSLGSLILAADLSMSCAGLVAINGFDRFAGDGAVPRRVIDRMRTRFTADPVTTLDEFRDRCGAAPAGRTIDAKRLGEDLDLLATADMRGVARPVLVLHGGADPILPPTMRDSVFDRAPRRTLADAGHLLPLTHPGWCAAMIRSSLP